ncbi:Deaminase [Trypanosoma melophagium]|uniref:Deaminase n=1 Tax=Trypanosoma melophagium TaxID=715481 RepID=UPI00351A8627|nr:Deaminase [Trypanosoma melophagium]
MPISREHIWNSLRFYTAYLPYLEAIKTLHYVVLTLNDDQDVTPLDGCVNNGTFTDSLITTPGTPRKDMNGTRSSSISVDPSGNAFPSSKMDVDTCNTTFIDDSRRCTTHTTLRFFLFRKVDVSPPPLKQMIGKIRYCFPLCNNSFKDEPCNCNKTHLINKNAWYLELSSFDYDKFYVSSHFSVYCIKAEDIRPTAGFLFACGLLHEHVLDAVQPALCRYNDRCRYGTRCLYVHADISPQQMISMTAAMPLRSQLRAEKDLSPFVEQLEEMGLRTVGDVQQLSDNAFDALVSRSEACWLPQWLNISAVRNLQPNFPLEAVLPTFPDVPLPLSLPPPLTTVASLIQLPTREFYALALPLRVQAVCEQIRGRFQPDRDYNIIDLKKEKEGSFLSFVTPLIVSFRHENAHVSWRKKDPQRPVVTSLITYVDPEECQCRSNEGTLPRGSFVRYTVLQKGTEKYPENSWCSCPRSFVIAVNYELSTPSGSRCSEQNAMGKLASMGLPTNSVREVFVHGENKGIEKDPNPLFPCGVCENMLRKVTQDVYQAHGGNVVLYMFDSTENPKKLVSLPINEISHRDGSGFKKFIEDLRDE